MSAIDDAAHILAARAHGSVSPGGSIAPLTSYRLGGPAGVLLEAASVDDLHALAAARAETGVDVLIVGRGSNMLVSDRGFPGIAVRLGAGFRWVRRDGDHLHAGAAMPLPALSTAARHEALAGLEFAVAIPASLGGAVRMNAGAHGHEMAGVCARVEVFRMDVDRVESIEGRDVGFAYRRSSLPVDSIVTAAELALQPGDTSAITDGMDEARRWRREHQPLNLPNGGSVFKNPEGDAAGRLVEQVCGRDMRVGGARISEVHANFIVAEPGARADDVYTLMRRIQRRVFEEAGVRLEPEIKLMGEFQEVTDD